MALTYKPCSGYGGVPCNGTTWRTNPQMCKRCLGRARRAGAVPPARPRRARHAHAPHVAAPAPAGPAPVFVKPDTPEESCLKALVALETAIGAVARVKGITDDMREAFKKYQKVKAHALAGLHAADVQTRNEAVVALKLALTHALNLTF